MEAIFGQSPYRFERVRIRADPEGVFRVTCGALEFFANGERCSVLTLDIVEGFSRGPHGSAQRLEISAASQCAMWLELDDEKSGACDALERRLVELGIKKLALRK